MANAVADTLGINVQDSLQVPELVMAESFFTKLADYGLVPSTHEEQQKLWECGELLRAQEAKIASAKQGNSPLDRGLAMLQRGLKTASASQSVQAQEAELASEVSSKTAMFLENPEVFAHGLSLFVESNAKK